MSETTQDPFGLPDDAEGDDWAAEPELPPRPRRRLLTPLTAALAAVLLAACGFVGGVLVEKGQASGSSAGRGAGLRSALAALGQRAGGAGGGQRAGGLGGGGAFGGGGGNATFGQVSSVEGRTLYVTDAQGNVIKVVVPAGESVSRTTAASVRSVHPGDTVVVQGSAGSDGTVTATSVRATAATSGGGALGQLFGGGQ